MEKQKIKVGLRVSKETYDRLKILAEKEHWSLSKIAEIATERYLNSRKVDAHGKSKK